MLSHSSNINVGDATQVNANRYENRGTTSHVVTVKGGSHYSSNVEVHAGVYNHHTGKPTKTLKELHANIAVGAMHNSDDLVDAPKCHAETRKAVQEDIFSWISQGGHGAHARKFLWLTGPAGAGKSAIMGTVSDILKERGQLAASFFFSSYADSVHRRSKGRFVTTLAYQLQRHPTLKAISSPMLSAIEHDPAIFDMSLKGQMEELILKPLRQSPARSKAHPVAELIVTVDGLDECEDNRSREMSQIELLSVLLQAIKDPAFPCRIIIASRPENWIRRFFTTSAARHVTEIFLDNRYNPDDDIELFLRSKFTELRRRFGFEHMAWPRDEDIRTLVQNASGQFIYAATVTRFVDTPPLLPQDQLEIVLKIQPHPTGSSPFRLLDALYTSILKSSPSPNDTVLWLQALQIVRAPASQRYRSSAWTINRLFESKLGQARMFLGLPSLVCLDDTRDNSHLPYDSFQVGREYKVPRSSIPKDGWNSGYSFYHKSLLDYLSDPERYGPAFPDVRHGRAERWLWERISEVLIRDGPEVAIDPVLKPTFKTCIYGVWYLELIRSGGCMLIRDDVLSSSDPAWWLRFDPFGPYSPKKFRQLMFIVSHKNCRLYRPCNPGCRRWRHAIGEFQGVDWRGSGWGTFGLLLDRFCVKRLEFRHIDVSPWRENPFEPFVAIQSLCHIFAMSTPIKDAPSPLSNLHNRATKQLHLGRTVMSSLDSIPFSAQVIEYILNSMPPETLVLRFRTALEPALGHTTEEFTAFLDALKGLGLERAVEQAEAIVKCDNKNPGKGGERHCVRCHKWYRESENGFNACTIAHSAVLFGAPTWSTSRHTTDVKQAMKTRGNVPVKTCQEQWCGRKMFGAEAVAVAPVFPPAAALGTATTANSPLTLSALQSPERARPQVPLRPSATTTGPANQATPVKDVKDTAVNGVSGVHPQTAAK